jgi:hypothetical protein
MNWATLLIIYLAIGTAIVFVLYSALLKRHGGYAPGWQLRCTKCGHTGDAGRAGLVRIGAWSAGKRTLGVCSKCKGLRLLAVERISG